MLAYSLQIELCRKSVFFKSGSRAEAKFLSYDSPDFPYLSYFIVWPPKWSKKILQRLGVMTLAWSLLLI